MYIAEDMIGRELRLKEVVHHLDLNKQNNHPKNLIVLESSQHAKLHGWLKRIDFNSTVKHLYCSPYCEVCGKILKSHQQKTCSSKCGSISRGVNQRKLEWPNPEELSQMMNTMSWVAIGRKYKVSDNTVRKWAKKYNIL
ncbi:MULTISPECIES: helix-turn-helix domain-containing protein [unclassified Paenibacillus]|uniref:helix-turn-helix domain-containing protein n=1 Tax=unclassified Paenibacillus TaxID=185978 RepID=UPI0021A9FB01|nr:MULTISPECIES: helix-turn-helix domain-containing protein [unclassified Paenibacillus]